MSNQIDQSVKQHQIKLPGIRAITKPYSMFSCCLAFTFQSPSVLGLFSAALLVDAIYKVIQTH